MMFQFIKNLGWRKSRRLYPSELDAIRAFLPAHDMRTERLLRQAVDPPWVERRVLDDSSFTVSIPYVKRQSDLVDCPVDIQSPSLAVRDIESGRDLELTLRIRRGGFLGPLIVRMVDSGPFVRKWTAKETPDSMQSNWLPPTMTVAEEEANLTSLLEWANTRPNEAGVNLVKVRRPAIDDAIELAESRLGRTLPESYREFLRISNGLTVGSLRLAGAEEIETTDLSSGSVTIISYLSANSILFIPCDSASIFLASPEAPGGREYAKDAEELVRKLLHEAASGS